MHELTRQTIEWLLVPVMAAQIFLTVLIYFSIVRKRLAEHYKGYVLFLGAFSLFLLGRPFQQYLAPPSSHAILYVRMILLLGVAMPSLLIASAMQSGFSYNRQLVKSSYGAGLFFAVLYMVICDATFCNLVLSRGQLDWLPFPVSVRSAHWVQVIAAAILMALPSGWFMVREWRGDKDRKHLAFLFGAFLFGTVFVYASIYHLQLGLFYIAAIFSALCWMWAVFQDVRDLKGRAALLKDELQLLAQKGSGDDMDKLLVDLENLSKGNLDVYKMRLREILSRLTDVSIEAGGDSGALVKRMVERSRAIDAESDADSLRKIVRNEAEKLSEMAPPMNPAVKKAQEFIDQHFNDDLSVEALAGELNISKAHLMREFKKATGKTVNQYLTALRIEKARELLATQNVTETAFDVGFNDPNYFSTVFKKQTGMTPGQYKKTLENEK